MKKLFAIVAVLGMFTFGTTQVFAQDAAEAAPVETVEQEEVVEEEAVAEEAPAQVTEAAETVGVHKALKTKFIEGGAEFMALVAVAMVIGLAFCVERIIYLSMAQVNTKKLMEAIAAALLHTANRFSFSCVLYSPEFLVPHQSLKTFVPKTFAAAIYPSNSSKGVSPNRK